MRRQKRWRRSKKGSTENDGDGNNRQKSWHREEPNSRNHQEANSKKVNRS